MRRVSLANLGLGVALAITGVNISLAQDLAAARKAWATRNTDEARSEWQRRYEAIVAEIAQLREHPWAGSYYRGENRLGIQERLVISPSAGFVLEIWSGCGSPGFHDRDFGAVNMTSEGGLLLKTALPDGQSDSEHVETELVPVDWGDRRYLVPRDEMIDFCGQINGGREPRDDIHGSFFLRDGDELKRAGGRPSIPVEFGPYLLEVPVTADVVAVDESKIVRNADGVRVSASTVRLSVGREQGILRGMKLFMVPEEIKKCGMLGVATVQSVQADQSVAMVRLITFESHFDCCDPSPLGKRFTTAVWEAWLEEAWD